MWERQGPHCLLASVSSSATGRGTCPVCVKGITCTQPPHAFGIFGTILSLLSVCAVSSVCIFLRFVNFLDLSGVSQDVYKTFPWYQATFLSNLTFLYHSMEARQLLTEPLVKKSLNLRSKMYNSLTLRNTVIHQKMNTRSHAQMHVHMKSVWGIHSEWGSLKMKAGFTVEGGYWLWLGFCLHFSHLINTREQEQLKI